MTSDNRDDITLAVELLDKLLEVAGNPVIREKLSKLRDLGQREIQERRQPINRDKEPRKGTCPTCGKTYTIKENGALRRHGQGYCYTNNQLPAEIVPAVILVAGIYDRSNDYESRGN